MAGGRVPDCTHMRQFRCPREFAVWAWTQASHLDAWEGPWAGVAPATVCSVASTSAHSPLRLVTCRTGEAEEGWSSLEKR